MERLREVIEAKGKSALKTFGADVEVLDVTIDGWVRVRLSIASIDDLFNDMPLVRVLEGILRDGFPEVKGVVPAIVIWKRDSLPPTGRVP